MGWYNLVNELEIISLSSSIADVFRWISSSTILVFLIALFFYENISELCRHKGWNRLLVHAEGLARKMSSILPMRWFWFVFGFVSGVAAITWLFWFFPSLTIPSRPMEISNALVRRQILETNRKNISQELLQIRQFKDRTLAAYIKCLRSENEKGSYAGPHEGCAFECRLNLVRLRWQLGHSPGIFRKILRWEIHAIAI